MSFNVECNNHNSFRYHIQINQADYESNIAHAKLTKREQISNKNRDTQANNQNVKRDTIYFMHEL